PEEQLWQLWRKGQQPDIRAFLQQVGPLPPGETVGVLRIDQRERWLLGERVLSEAYLNNFPTVRADPEAAVDLVYGEILLREELGEPSILDEYLQRFPEHAIALRRQLEVHAEMRTSDAGGARLVQE